MINCGLAAIGGRPPHFLARSHRSTECSKALGAKSSPNTINKSTDIVVVGDKGGKKVKQAEEMGVTVICADEFLKLIGK